MIKLSIKFFLVLLFFFPFILNAATYAKAGVDTNDKEVSLPYISKNVMFNNEDNSIRFGATLTLPDTLRRHQAVILVSGTGAQDRDGTMAGHKMFATIADNLTRRGIAVLRVDDRGVGQTTGVYETSTTGDFAKDVLAFICFLKSQKGIDSKDIGLIGHSEGGAVISIVTAQSNDVAFMISIAGLATDGLTALKKQNRDIVDASSLPSYDKGRSNDINELMFNTAYAYANSDSMEAKLNETYNKWKVKGDAYFKTLNIEFDHFRFPVYSYVKSAVGPWYRYFIQYDPARYLTKVKVPVLAINGDRDLMVACNENLANFKKYLTEAENKDFKIVSVPGLNHLFQHCKLCTREEYKTLKESFAPEVLDLMGNWILSHKRNK